MEKLNKKILLISLLLAAITTLLVFNYLSKSPAKVAAVEKTRVYVAAKDMPELHEITEDDISEVSIPSDMVSPGSCRDKAQIAGKIVREPIYKGEQILAERLLDIEKAIMSYRIPDGKRAVSININEQIAVSGLLRPGDHVDIAVSIEREELDDAGTKTVFPRTTSIILQDIEVLALGQDMTLPDDKLNELPRTITLAVKPVEVEKLVYASEFGIIRIALRGSGDNSKINTIGTTRKNLR